MSSKTPDGGDDDGGDGDANDLGNGGDSHHGFESATSSPRGGGQEEEEAVVPPLLETEASPLASPPGRPAAPKANAGAWIGRVHQNAAAKDGANGSGGSGGGDRGGGGGGGGGGGSSSSDGDAGTEASAPTSTQETQRRVPQIVEEEEELEPGGGAGITPIIQVPRHPTARSKHLSTVSNSSDEASTTCSPAAATPREDIITPMAMPRVIVSVSENGGFSETSSAVTSPRSIGIGLSSRRWSDVVGGKGKEPSFRQLAKAEAGESTASLFAAAAAADAPLCPSVPPRTSTISTKTAATAAAAAAAATTRGHRASSSAPSMAAASTTTEASAAAAVGGAAEMGAAAARRRGSRGRRRSATPRASHDPFLREKMEAKPTFLTMRPCECGSSSGGGSSRGVVSAQQLTHTQLYRLAPASRPLPPSRAAARAPPLRLWRLLGDDDQRLPSSARHRGTAVVGRGRGGAGSGAALSRARVAAAAWRRRRFDGDWQR